MLEIILRAKTGFKKKARKFAPLLAAVLFLGHQAWAEPSPPHDRKPRPPRQLHRHGERQPYAQYQFFCVKEIEREDGEIEIEFNLPFNPETVTRSSILVNGEALPPEVFFSFNRRGNKISILEPEHWRWREITLEVQNIRSVSGLEMTALPALYLDFDEDYEWDEPHKTRWAQ